MEVLCIFSCCSPILALPLLVRFSVSFLSFLRFNAFHIVRTGRMEVVWWRETTRDHGHARDDWGLGGSPLSNSDALSCFPSFLGSGLGRGPTTRSRHRLRHSLRRVIAPAAPTSSVTGYSVKTALTLSCAIMGCRRYAVGSPRGRFLAGESHAGYPIQRSGTKKSVEFEHRSDAFHWV